MSKAATPTQEAQAAIQEAPEAIQPELLPCPKHPYGADLYNRLMPLLRGFTQEQVYERIFLLLAQESRRLSVENVAARLRAVRP